MRTSVQIELTGASQLMKERRSSARIDAPYPARLRRRERSTLQGRDRASKPERRRFVPAPETDGARRSRGFSCRAVVHGGEYRRSCASFRGRRNGFARGAANGPAATVSLWSSCAATSSDVSSRKN